MNPMRMYPACIGLLLISILMGIGCSTNQTTQEQTPVSSQSGISQTAVQEILQNAKQYRLGDSTMFPYVYQGPETSHIFEAYSMRFSLTYADPLVPMLNSQVKWIDQEKFTDGNGVFMTYVRNGREVSLQNPYIQVQYISKALPGASTIDSVYIWLDGLHLKGEGARQMGSTFDLTTASGKSAHVKDYFTGTTQGRDPKYLSYAYIDFDDSYILGMALTTMLESDYEVTKPAFHKLVKTFSIH